MNHNDFQTVLPALKALDSDRVVSPTMPVPFFLQEAENLSTWMRGDIAALKEAGLEDEVLDGFQARIGALREAQSEWVSRRHTKEEAQVAYDAQSVGAFKMLNDALVHMRFAYRRRPDVLCRLPLPSDRRTDEERFQLMNDLAVVGRENIEPLEACGFDVSRLAQMAQLSDMMANLCSCSAEERRKGRGAKLMRDRAFTWLKEAMDEVRETARFVFREDPERLDGYRSEYVRRKNARSGEAEEAVEADSAIEEESADLPEASGTASDEPKAA